jgi:hypothetical protein
MKLTNEQKQDFQKGAMQGLGFSLVLVVVLLIVSVPVVPIMARYATNSTLSALGDAFEKDRQEAQSRYDASQRALEESREHWRRDLEEFKKSRDLVSPPPSDF